MKYFKRMLASGLLALALSALIAACAGTKAAYKEADDPLDYAYVVMEHYAVLLEQAVALKGRPSTPASAVAAMQKADNAAAPVILGLQPLVDQYIRAATAYDELQNAETEAAKAAAAAALQLEANNAVRLVADFIRAVRTAGGSISTVIEDRRIDYSLVEVA